MSLLFCMAASIMKIRGASPGAMSANDPAAQQEGIMSAKPLIQLVGLALTIGAAAAIWLRFVTAGYAGSLS
jgi:hypothetical protein